MRSFASTASTLGLALLACLPFGCAPLESVDPAPLPDDPPYEPPAPSCEAPSMDAPRGFSPCNIGGGIFGTWTIDDLGLPAYDYGLDQNADARASFFNTEELDRRDHWTAFGNARVNALFFNDGYIELTTQDRGETYLNKFDEAQGNYAGGFSFLDDGAATWSSAYKYRPRGTKTTRRFGMGYIESSMEHRGVLLLRRSFAPAGDAPFILDEVTIENRSDIERTIKHYEYWDVGRRPIDINWLVSGKPFTAAPAEARRVRDERNALFDEEVVWEEGVLGVRRTHAAGTSPKPPETPDSVDEYPGDPFVAVLVGEASDLYVDQASFFGEGGPAAPEAVAHRLEGLGTAPGQKGAAGSALGQPRMLGVRSDFVLAPGEKKVLRFAYGYTPMGEPFSIDPVYRDPARDFRAEQASELKKHLMYFVTDGGGSLQRELAWHASQMEVSVSYRDYWGVHVVPQGSAYLYLHGADGAARDLSLFAVPLVYTHPGLAKEELALNMMITHASDRRISYAFQGHGMLDDALGLHKKPSDLTIFLLWAVSEYVGATGDLAFLDEAMPFYPKEAEPGATVYDHVHDAIRHLFDVVGTGEHGLLRIGTGDWSDGIVMEAPNRDLAIEKGESVPNTQMAVAVLPAVADLVEPRDAALAQEIRDKVVLLRAAAEGAFTGSFFGRAYFGDGELAYGKSINLEAQVWALIGDTFPAPGDREMLIATIKEKMDDPSPTGAGLWPGGQVWPAVSGLLTWGYAESGSELAFRHLVKNTMASHAIAFPEVWYGIWSGPDGLNSVKSSRPGESWHSQVTPMVDFPVMNNNQHGMPLLAALRVAGIRANAAGLRIAPRVPSRSFSLETELLDLSQRGRTIRGVYRPPGDAARTLTIEAPEGEIIVSAKVNGAAVSVSTAAERVSLDVPAKGAATSFEVETAPK